MNRRPCYNRTKYLLMYALMYSGVAAHGQTGCTPVSATALCHVGASCGIECMHRVCIRTYVSLAAVAAVAAGCTTSSF